MNRSRGAGFLLGSGLLVLAACESGPVEPTPPRQQPVPKLVALESSAGSIYSRVKLRFEPGTQEPTADIEEVGDSALAGDQALRITVSQARAKDVRIVQPPPDAPAVAELRVLGSSDERVTVGAGIRGTGDLSVRIFEINSATLVVSVRNPERVPDQGAGRDCGAVQFEPSNDSGAFDIVAQGVGCMVAREVAARAEADLGDSYRTPSGFTCEPRRAGSESTPTVDYTCTRDQATIRFNTS